MNYINKFGESLNKPQQQQQQQIQITDNKYHIELLRILDVSVTNQCFDVHTKRICNLSAPVDAKDAVTKQYLNNKIEKINNTHANDMKWLKNEINTSIANNVDNVYKDIKNHKTDIEQLKQLYKEIENIKAIHKSDIENLTQIHNEIENIKIKHSSDIKQLQIDLTGIMIKNHERVYIDLDNINKSIQNFINKQENTIEQSTKKYILHNNKEYKDKVEERFNKLEEYILKLSAVDERISNIEDYLFKNLEYKRIKIGL